MQSRFRRLTSTLAVAAVVACGGTTTQAPAGNDRELLTFEQLSAGNYRNVFEAIESLRPTWLRDRGPDSFRSPSQVVVYLDNVKLGGVDELKGILPINVGYARHYSAAEASNRWGLDHGAGAIYLATRTGR